MLLNYLVGAVVFICACQYNHAATLPPVECAEPNTEYDYSCKNNCTDQCPKVPPQACPEICIRGCYCKQGYSKAPNGTCVQTENCPVQCPDKETFQNRCTDSCDEDQIACKTNFYGCFCKPAYKRIKGKCVPEAKCYNCTGKNEMYSDCSNPCHDSCPGPEPAVCAAYCKKGCSCKQNHKRDPKTNRCIPISQCKVKCPKNSTYGCICNDSCQKNEIRCMTCLYQCACDAGFSRINSTCHPDSLCPKSTTV